MIITLKRIRQLAGLNEQDDQYDDEYQFEPETYTIPPGTELFHGTSMKWDETIEDLQPPFWVTEINSDAEFFVDWNDGNGQRRMISLITTAPLNLVLFHNLDDMNEFSEYTGIDMDYPHDAAEDMCNDGYNGWIVPSNYRSGGSDIMMCSSYGLEYVRTDLV